MSAKIIVLFNLRPGVKVEDYEAWARAVDLPGVNGLNSVDRFVVLKATGLLGTEGHPPYDYVEIIDVNDMQKFGADVDTDQMKAVASSFQEMADSPIFILTEVLE